MKQLGIVSIVVLGLLGAACSKHDAPPAGDSTATATEDKATTATGAVADNAGGALGDAKAKEIFQSRCSACHGPEGRGDGPGAAALNPKPRNYHDKEWQAKVTDDEISKAILYGGAAIGKSPMMPANPDLDSQPQVLASLVHTVRQLGKQ